MADIKVRVGQKNAIKVTSSLSGASAGSLGELSDVNVSNPQNGMVLVYNSTTQQWTGTLELTPGASTEFGHKRRKFLKWQVL
tara:strand:- start:828 stop:1073 length:246 start_codon:yes stop_codon:yes gene_type:complete